MRVLLILLGIALTTYAIPTKNDGARQKRGLDGIFDVNFPPFFDDIVLVFSESDESDDSDKSASHSTEISTTKSTPQSTSKPATTEDSTNSSPLIVTSATTQSTPQTTQFASTSTGAITKSSIVEEPSTGSPITSGKDSVRQKRNVPGFFNFFGNGIRDVDEAANKAFNDFANFVQTGEKDFVGWVNHASQNIANMFPVNSSPPAGSAPPAGPSTANSPASNSAPAPAPATNS